MMTERTVNKSSNSSEKSPCSISKTSTENYLANYWNGVYHNATVSKLGWYEEDPEPSMRMINLCNLKKGDVLLNVGAGATTLIDVLVAEGYEEIIANDLSSSALATLQARLGGDSEKVNWVIDDVTHPCRLQEIGQVDLWHDRAVLHFFNDKKDQIAYFDLLRRLVKKNGFVIIAAFNLEGALKCSGLPVHRYDTEMLQECLGSKFELVESFDYTYMMPSGDLREYVYTLFRRSKS